MNIFMEIYLRKASSYNVAKSFSSWTIVNFVKLVSITFVIESFNFNIVIIQYCLSNNWSKNEYCSFNIGQAKLDLSGECSGGVGVILQFQLVVQLEVVFIF